MQFVNLMDITNLDASVQKDSLVLPTINVSVLNVKQIQNVQAYFLVTTIDVKIHVIVLHLLNALLLTTKRDVNVHQVTLVIHTLHA